MSSAAIKAMLFAVLAGLLAGCQTPLVDETGPLSVRSVTVTTNPTVKSATDIGPALQTATATTIVKGMTDGRPATVHISVDRVMYKNPAMSMLVGSANSLNTTVSVTDENGAPISRFPHSAVADYAVNGLIGAAMAAMQDPAAVDQQLVEQYAQGLRTRIYGPAGHKPKKAAKPVQAQAAPAQVAPAAAPVPPAKPAVPTS